MIDLYARLTLPAVALQIPAVVKALDGFDVDLNDDGTAAIESFDAKRGGSKCWGAWGPPMASCRRETP